MNRQLATAAALFRGQALGCHTVAAMQAFLPHYDPEQALCFEALTGVPFGTRSQAGDPNRLIAPILDPDLGLDRAFTLLDLQPETCWFEPTEGVQALALLTSWLRDSPVLLGPLDMGGLSYLSHPELFSGCDHYVVALELNCKGLWLLDGEGASPALMRVAEFMHAWAATGIPEGRGAFMLRRCTARCASPPSTDSLLAGIRQAARLTAQAGSSSAEVYRALAAREAQLLACPSERRGLEFLLPIRAQRNLAAMALSDAACAIGDSESWGRHLKVMSDEWLGQCLIVGQCVAGLLAREPGCLQALREFATREETLTTLFHDLENP